VRHDPTAPFVPHVVAQNGFRRPAALLAYEVAWANADGVETPIDPPELVEQVDVPATGQLEALDAIFDVLTGDAPWAPVLSPHLNLARRLGASRTHYQVVLLGPSTSASVPPIMADPRFEGFHDAWDDIVLEKSLELFLDELLLPLVEVYGLGTLAKYDANKLTQMRTRVRIIADEHLLGLGVYLRAGRSGYADALRFAIDRLVESREFRLELMDTITEALIESDRNRAGVQAMERRLSARASASAIAAAVQTMMVGGDVAKVMLDLSDSIAAEDWTAISAQALFARPSLRLHAHGAAVRRGPRRGHLPRADPGHRRPGRRPQHEPSTRRATPRRTSLPAAGCATVATRCRRTRRACATTRRRTRSW